MCPPFFYLKSGKRGLHLQIHNFSPVPKGSVDSRHIHYQDERKIMDLHGKFTVFVSLDYFRLAEAL